MKKFALILLSMAALSGFAGGFQLNLQSVRAIGLGGAYTGFAYGPSSVFFNPGGMSQVKGHQLMAGINLVFPKVSLQTEMTDNINQTSGLSTPFHFYYSGEIIKDKLYAGLAINNLFGSSSSFEENWEGRFIVQNIGLKTFSFQPTFNYKLHERLSIGAGFVLTSGSFSFEKAVPLGSSSSDYGKASLSGSGLAYGFNVGLFSNLIETDQLKLTLGASYRSRQKISLDNGVANFSDIPVSLQGTFPEETAFSSALNLPAVFTAGFSVKYDLKEDHSLLFVYDFNYTSWSSYDTLAFDFANADTPDSKTTKAWENSPTFRFGLEYAFQEMLYLRVGGYYDVTPIQDGFVSPELPDANQFVPTAGVGILLNDKIGFDVSWIHQDSKRTADLTDAGFSASYRRIADVISFSASFKF
ncbi:MAG: outer membrane protein transport protein [Flavobacteriales bacterium]|nr:outer membrane protein transport protein [Flavobacteriales bacterium]